MIPHHTTLLLRPSNPPDQTKPITRVASGDSVVGAVADADADGVAAVREAARFAPRLHPRYPRYCEERNSGFQKQEQRW